MRVLKKLRVRIQKLNMFTFRASGQSSQFEEAQDAKHDLSIPLTPATLCVNP